MLDFFTIGFALFLASNFAGSTMASFCMIGICIYHYVFNMELYGQWYIFYMELMMDI